MASMKGKVLSKREMGFVRPRARMQPPGLEVMSSFKPAPAAAEGTIKRNFHADAKSFDKMTI
jgi:hypothetical protein